MSDFDTHSFRKEVQNMQYQLKDHLSKPGDPLAQKLKTNLQRLEDDLQSGHHTNPYTVRAELKQMRDMVHHAGQDHVMNYGTQNQFHHWLDHHINNLR